MSKLKDIVLSAYNGYEQRKAFNLGTNCVSSLLLSELAGCATNGLKKIIVQADLVADSPPDRMDDVCRVHLAYDFDFHWKSNVVDRKQLMLKALFDGAMLVPDTYCLDKQRLTDAYKRLRDTSLEYVRKWGKSIKSPDGSRYAQIKYDYGLNCVRVLVEVTEADNSGTPVEVQLAQTPPHELRFVPLLGKLKWLDNNSIALEPKGKGLSTLTASF